MQDTVYTKQYGDIKDILKIRLSKKRYTHSVNVAEAAERLADRFGCDKDKAYLAGLVHDICKECPREEQYKMACSCRQGLGETEKKIPPLYHAAAGSWYCENVLHIEDGDILNAVRYHTAGRSNMSLLEEIIYLADLTSSDRSYKDVGRMRKLAESSLRTAMLEALRFSISDTIGKGSFIPENTCEAYNYYAQLAGERNKQDIS